MLGADAGQQVGAGLEPRQGHPVQGARTKKIVAVEPGDHLPISQPEALVDGLGLAAVGFDNQVIQAVAVAFENVDGAVGRCAIDDDVLEVGILLVEYGEQRLFDESCLVERWSDDADARPISGAFGQTEAAGREGVVGPCDALHGGPLG